MSNQTKEYHTAIKTGGEGSGRGQSGAHVYKMCREKKSEALPSCLPQACGKFSLVDTQIPLTKWLGADGTDLSVLIASSFVFLKMFQVVYFLFKLF